MELPSIKFIKVDAEGHEPEVIAGAKELISRDRPIIYTEINVWCLSAFAGHSPGSFVKKLWEVFDVSAPQQDGTLTRLDNPYSFLHDAIAHTAGIADIVLIPRSGASVPTVEAMTWPRSALAVLGAGRQSQSSGQHPTS